MNLHEAFQSHVEVLPRLLTELNAAEAQTSVAHQKVPIAPGIYLFSNDEGPQYVGQTRNLRMRLRQHTNSKSRQNQASFAYRIALEAAERMIHAVNKGLKESPSPG